MIIQPKPALKALTANILMRIASDRHPGTRVSPERNGGACALSICIQLRLNYLPAIMSKHRGPWRGGFHEKALRQIFSCNQKLSENANGHSIRARRSSDSAFRQMLGELGRLADHYELPHDLIAQR